MKKLSGLIIFTVLFFSIKSFAGNHSSFPAGSRSSSGSIFVPKDSIKKVTDTVSSDDDDDDGTDTLRSYAIGIEYGSDQSYHGVHSNVKLPYIEPNFTYTSLKGFYAEASVQDILIKKGGGFDALDLNPGWNIDLADNTTLNFNYSHYVFRSGTPITIESDLSNVLEGYIDQSIGETEGKFSIDYDYYKRTSKVRTPGDIVMTPDIEHTFKIKLSKKSSLSLVPEGSMDFGTRNAYSHYQANAGDTVQYVTNPKTGKQVRESQTPNNSSFGTLDYSLVFTITYKIGHFEVEPAINYIAPLYIPSGVSNKPIGYLTLALTYTIY
ncbi:MAG TPA: hypothetical protein VK808_01335 [Bacteroidia bacterium]|jgi:hypothetical protein|nr:hypothetical protein [Bacteroidia bacterium]